MNLVEIRNLPIPEKAAVRLDPADNVAVALADLPAGMRILAGGAEVVLKEPAPAGHKVALRAMEAGETVFRYGQAIGRTRVAVAAGVHVHAHNVSFEEIAFSYEFPEVGRPLPALPEFARVFQGYEREDGRAGTRNYIAVAAASNCAAHTVELIRRSYEGVELPPNVDGVEAFPHGEGCGMAEGADLAQLRRTLWGVLDHPNVAGALVVGLGCEVNQVSYYAGAEALKQGRVQGLTLQANGGARGVVEEARKLITRMLDRAADTPRVPCPATKLTVGLNCGGSDSFSGITANPALGVCSDLLAGAGATFVLAETPEIVGAEHLLVKRARNRAVAEKLLEQIENYREYLRKFGGSFDDNPSPGNKRGGLTNILEKSLGAAAKAGSSALNEVVDYAERVHGPGFVFMNTPGYDPVSLSGLAAGGANLICFTTGRGSAIGFPTVPVIKISSNTGAFRRMADHIDLNAGRMADGEASLEDLGREIFELALKTASGQRTSSERLGHKEFVPWRIGPVM
jgi:altronate hydrolase